MRYEPTAPSGKSEIEELMMPFASAFDGRDWETIEAVAECMEQLKDPYKSIIELVFYDRVPYSELASKLGTKAKSYAWRQAQKAIQEFTKILMEHPKIKEKYSDASNME